MKAVILAGGLGTRISEETAARPKPMVEIGGKPILWHIMKIYSAHGINDFIVCCGYKGYLIKEYFANYFLHMSDVTFDMREQRDGGAPEARRALARDAGRHRRGDDDRRPAEARARLSRRRRLLHDLRRWRQRHRHRRRCCAFTPQSGKLATITAVQPPGRFGALDVRGRRRCAASSRSRTATARWINGGFFVLSPKVLDYIDGDDTLWEREPLERLAADGQLGAFRHRGFWQPMDTLRDKTLLEELWQSGKAPWKVWE